MENASLRQELRSIIDQYGIDRVAQAFREVRSSSGQSKAAKQNRLPRSHGTHGTGSGKKSLTKVDVPEYVAKMDVPADNRWAIAELARRFQSRAFLPTFGDIRDFCAVYGIEEPKSKSRAGAVPRVFKFLAAMDAEEVKRIVHDELYSGPTRLGPIADAIRKNGRAARMKPE